MFSATARIAAFALLCLRLALSAAEPASGPVAGKDALGGPAPARFPPEAGAKLRIAVDSGAWGKAISDLWDKNHPEAAGAVSFTVLGPSGNLSRLSKPGAPDLLFLSVSDATLRPEAFLPLDPLLEARAKARVPAPFLAQGNPSAGARFIPVAYEGMVFAWNWTMLEELGLDVSDHDRDGLPDAFDSWEKIFALAASWRKERPRFRGKALLSAFPLCLDDPWSAYPAAAASGWAIFAEGDPRRPGFEKPGFREGLEFIQAASEAPLCAAASLSRLPGSACSWRWEEFLSGACPFGLVGSWTDPIAAERKGGFDIRVGPMPRWRNARPLLLARTQGFAVNARSPWPSAAQELLRLILTREGAQAMLDTCRKIPVLAPGGAMKLDYPDPALEEMAAAFSGQYPEPMLLLPGSPARKAMDLYFSIGANRFYQAVWDGKLSPREAQFELYKRSVLWLAAN